MAADKGDSKSAQGADQAKPAKKVAKSSGTKLSTDQRTLQQAQIWYGDLAQTHKDGHQLRKRKAVEPKKADKKSASKQPKGAPKKVKASA